MLAVKIHSTFASVAVSGDPSEPGPAKEGQVHTASVVGFVLEALVAVQGKASPTQTAEKPGLEVQAGE